MTAQRPDRLPCPRTTLPRLCLVRHRNLAGPAQKAAKRQGKRLLLACAAAYEVQELGDGELVAGIDLGTTNSCIAITKGEAVQVVPNPDGHTTVPSVVAFLNDESALVGLQAKRHARTDPQNSFYSIKRFIGQAMEDVQIDAGKVAFQVMADKDGLAVLSCNQVDGGTLYPEEVSARVLSYLLSYAEEYAGAEIKKAVISVPAYFDDAQREATIAAGKMAGVDNVKLIKEPVAAALAYGINVKEDQTIMVLDLGGGTFDVSILEVGGGVVEVLSSGGDSHLGGDDWDNAIIDWIASNYLPKAGVSSRNPGILGNLKAVAELAKIKLSTERQVALKLPIGSAGSEPIMAKLTQVQLDRLSEPLFRRLRLPVDACCWQAGVDLEEVLKEHNANRKKPAAKQRSGGVLIRPKNRPPVSRVLLVGGATRMPAFQQFVVNMTGVKPDKTLVDPDLAVAIGAAVHAGSLGNDSGSLSKLETMDPFRKALMQAIATKQLLENEALAREQLGDDYDAFMKQQQRKEEEWARDEAEASGED